MITSSPQTPNPNNKKYILLIGPPGSRKTTLALQFPKLAAFDLDLNLKGPETVLRNGITRGGKEVVPVYNKDLSYDFSCPAEGKDPGSVYDELHAQVTNLKGDYSWVLIDSLTAINEYIIQKIMKEQRISYMEARNWSTFKSDAIKILFTTIRKLPYNFIVTAHEVRVEVNDKKDLMVKNLIGYEPFIQSKVSELLGGFFTDVWRMEAALAPGDKVEVTTYFDKIPLMQQLKNSCGLPPSARNVTFRDLAPYLNGGAK